MNGKLAWGVVALLLVVIVVLAWILFAVPRPAEAPTTATSTPGTSGTPTPPSPQPLHARVIVTSPKAGATVGKTFTVTGEAPGNWYFEASFPMQVRDKDNNKIGQTTGQAQSDLPAAPDAAQAGWMTTAQVRFTATVTVQGYTGPATLVLLRDNPSGLPENDDSLEIPIVIQ